MGETTGIQWTDATWNPSRGCSRISEGCRNCYAERVASRFANKGEPYHGFAAAGRWTHRVELVPRTLLAPLSLRAPRRVFVNSMSDLFHEALTNEAIAVVFGIMAATPRHTFQALTKRATRMREWFEWCEATRNKERNRIPEIIEHAACVARELGVDASRLFKAANEAVGRDDWPLRNVWLGVSVEDQKHADLRVPLLMATPAAVRFVSYEPALEAVDFAMDHECGDPPHTKCPPVPDWIIVGGESGPLARRFDVGWARETIRQCRDAGVACFVKQLGSNPTTDARTRPQGEDWTWTLLKDRKGGDMLEWPEDLRVREFPRAL